MKLGRMKTFFAAENQVRRLVICGLVFGLFPAVVLAPTTAGAALAAPKIPCRTAKVIVPWQSGGATDIVARIFVNSVNKAGAKPQLQVVNVWGQGGNKGARKAAKAKPDGCTLFFIHESAMTSYLMGRVGFSYDSFEPVALLTRTWAIIVANKNVPYNDLKGLTAHAKKNPKKVLVGVTRGTTSYLAILSFADAAGADLKYVPYKGTGGRMAALLASNIQVGLISITAASKYIKSGEIKALGILSPNRSPIIPNVPTARELGYDVEFATSRGVVAPLGTPKDVIDHYVALFEKAAKDPSVKKQMDAKGTDIVFISKDEYGKFMKKSFENMMKLWLGDAKIAVYLGPEIGGEIGGKIGGEERTVSGKGDGCCAAGKNGDGGAVMAAAPPAAASFGNTPPSRTTAPPSLILKSVYGFLHGRDKEVHFYGLYSYALFPVHSLRAEHFLEELFKSTGAASESVIDPSYLNLIYLPIKVGQVATLESATSRGQTPPVKLFASQLYDYALASGLLAQICAEPAERVRELCAGDLSRGPYLFSYARPASTLFPIPPPYLFVDLSDVHERAFGEFISAYKAQVKRTDIADLERIKTLRLRLLSIFLTAADWVTPIKKAVAEIVHIVKD